MAERRQTRGLRKRQRSTLDDALRAYELASIGYSFRAVAKEMQLSGPQQAKNLFKKGEAEYVKLSVEATRGKLIGAANQMFATFAKKALSGDAEASREARGWFDLFAKITGAYAPTSIKLEGHTFSDDQLRLLAAGAPSEPSTAGEGGADAPSSGVVQAPVSDGEGTGEGA